MQEQQPVYTIIQLLLPVPITQIHDAQDYLKLQSGQTTIDSDSRHLNVGAFTVKLEVIIYDTVDMFRCFSLNLMNAN